MWPYFFDADSATPDRFASTPANLKRVMHWVSSRPRVFWVRKAWAWRLLDAAISREAKMAAIREAEAAEADEKKALMEKRKAEAKAMQEEYAAKQRAAKQPWQEHFTPGMC